MSATSAHTLASRHVTRREVGYMCSGALRPCLAEDGLPVCVRLPGGSLPTASLARLLKASAMFRDGDVHLTTAAGIGPLGLPAVGDRLPAAPLWPVKSTGLLASSIHDRERDNLVPKLTGIVGGRANLRPTMRQLDAVLGSDPDFGRLPERFLFTLDDGSEGLLGQLAQFGLQAADSGLIALDDNESQPRVATAGPVSSPSTRRRHGARPWRAASSPRAEPDRPHGICVNFDAPLASTGHGRPADARPLSITAEWRCRRRHSRPCTRKRTHTRVRQLAARQMRGRRPPHRDASAWRLRSPSLGGASMSTTARHWRPTRPSRRYEYMDNGAAIYVESFATIRRDSDLSAIPPAAEKLAVRMIHGSGQPDLVDDLVIHPDLVQAARAALDEGAPILCDAFMVATGITASRLPAGNTVRCLLRDERVPDLARHWATTRTAAAVSLWEPYLGGAVVAIGNAPTALFHLLEMILDGAPCPSAIVGCPVGFIGAKESKEALIALAAQYDIDIPYVTIRGRRGGSAITSSALNALASEAE